jgi:hypothetical protein
MAWTGVNAAGTTAARVAGTARMCLGRRHHTE